MAVFLPIFRSFVLTSTKHLATKLSCVPCWRSLGPRRRSVVQRICLGFSIAQFQGFDRERGYRHNSQTQRHSLGCSRRGPFKVIKDIKDLYPLASLSSAFKGMAVVHGQPLCLPLDLQPLPNTARSDPQGRAALDQCPGLFCVEIESVHLALTSFFVSFLGLVMCS